MERTKAEDRRLLEEVVARFKGKVTIIKPRTAEEIVAAGIELNTGWKSSANSPKIRARIAAAEQRGQALITKVEAGETSVSEKKKGKVKIKKPQAVKKRLRKVRVITYTREQIIDLAEQNKVKLDVGALDTFMTKGHVCGSAWQDVESNLLLQLKKVGVSYTEIALLTRNSTNPIAERNAIIGLLDRLAKKANAQPPKPHSPANTQSSSGRRRPVLA
jgi:hypothetical protein